MNITHIMILSDHLKQIKTLLMMMKTLGVEVDNIIFLTPNKTTREMYITRKKQIDNFCEGSL